MNLFFTNVHRKQPFRFPSYDMQRCNMLAESLAGREKRIKTQQYVAQFPATLVCNRANFLFMHGNFLIFLQETVHLLTFKMYGDRLPT